MDNLRGFFFLLLTNHKEDIQRAITSPEIEWEKLRETCFILIEHDSLKIYRLFSNGCRGFMNDPIVSRTGSNSLLLRLLIANYKLT